MNKKLLFSLIGVFCVLLVVIVVIVVTTTTDTQEPNSDSKEETTIHETVAEKATAPETNGGTESDSGIGNTDGSGNGEEPTDGTETETKTVNQTETETEIEITTETEPETIPHTHTYGDWETVLEPTCTEAGEQSRSCTCGDVQGQEIPATGHTESEWIIDQEADYEVEGSKHIECTVCGEVIQTSIIAMLQSNGLQFTFNDDGTCYVSGIGTCTDVDIVIPPKHNSSRVTGIGYRAFSGCYDLISITIPNSVTSIGAHAFECCTSLTTITIPDSVTSIGDSAFDGCTSLTTITIPNSVTGINFGTFYMCSRLTEITIPNSVASIGVSAFLGCDDLTDIYYNGTINEWKQITIGNNNNCLENATLHYHASTTPSVGLEFVSNGDGTCYVSDVGTCTDIDIVIPSEYNGNRVTGIGYQAFSFNHEIIRIVIPYSVTNINDEAIYYCANLTEITVDENNPIYHSAGNCLIETVSGTLVAGCQSSVIPNDGSVTSISDYAFYSCDSLTEITIPDSVINIGEHAFSGCNGLTKITIPDSVTNIGNSTFTSCDSLTKITIPDSVASISDYMFYSCDGLTEITIPNTVTSIGDEAFYRCEALTDVYYTGTQEEWKQITIGRYNGLLTSATIHFNSQP